MLSCRGQGQAPQARRETLAMPTWSVGSGELYKPRTEADGEACHEEQPQSSPTHENTISICARALSLIDLHFGCAEPVVLARRALSRPSRGRWMLGLSEAGRFSFNAPERWPCLSKDVTEHRVWHLETPATWPFRQVWARSLARAGQGGWRLCSFRAPKLALKLWSDPPNEAGCQARCPNAKLGAQSQKMANIDRQ